MLDILHSFFNCKCCYRGSSNVTYLHLLPFDFVHTCNIATRPFIHVLQITIYCPYSQSLPILYTVEQEVLLQLFA